MGFFSTPKPKGITEKELKEGKSTLFGHEGSVIGRLKHGYDKFKPQKVKEFEAIVHSSMENEDRVGTKKFTGIITANEVSEIEKQMKMTGRFKEDQIKKAVNELKRKI